MKKLILLWLCLFSLQAFAKIDTPVHWKFASTKIDQDKYAVSFTADIDNGWHLYSQFLKSGGPVPTSFKFDQTPGLSLAGKVTEKPAALSGFDQSFQMTICYHEHQVTFTQIVNQRSGCTCDRFIELHGLQRSKMPAAYWHPTESPLQNPAPSTWI